MIYTKYFQTIVTICIVISFCHRSDAEVNNIGLSGPDLTQLELRTVALGDGYDLAKHESRGAAVANFNPRRVPQRQTSWIELSSEQSRSEREINKQYISGRALYIFGTGVIQGGGAFDENKAHEMHSRKVTKAILWIDVVGFDEVPNEVVNTLGKRFNGTADAEKPKFFERHGTHLVKKVNLGHAILYEMTYFERSDIQHNDRNAAVNLAVQWIQGKVDANARQNQNRLKIQKEMSLKVTQRTWGAPGQGLQEARVIVNGSIEGAHRPGNDNGFAGAFPLTFEVMDYQAAFGNDEEPVKQWDEIFARDNLLSLMYSERCYAVALENRCDFFRQRLAGQQAADWRAMTEWFRGYRRWLEANAENVLKLKDGAGRDAPEKIGEVLKCATARDFRIAYIQAVKRDGIADGLANAYKNVCGGEVDLPDPAVIRFPVPKLDVTVATIQGGMDPARGVQQVNLGVDVLHKAGNVLQPGSQMNQPLPIWNNCPVLPGGIHAVHKTFRINEIGSVSETIQADIRAQPVGQAIINSSTPEHTVERIIQECFLGNNRSWTITPQTSAPNVCILNWNITFLVRFQ